ncbi:MAG: hypothetical protein AAF628_21430 [Planctomycetota bacterium]
MASNATTRTSSFRNPNLPRRLYHGTHAGALDAILARGIEPYDPGDGHRVTVLSPTYPGQLAAAATPADGQALFVEIDTAALDVDQLYPDESLFLRALAQGQEASDEIRRRARQFAADYRDSWIESLSLIGLCAYRAVVPIAAVTRWAVLDTQSRPWLAEHLLHQALSPAEHAVRAEYHRAAIAWLFGDAAEHPSLGEARLELRRHELADAATDQVRDKVAALAEESANRRGIRLGTADTDLPPPVAEATQRPPQSAAVTAASSP